MPILYTTLVAPAVVFGILSLRRVLTGVLSQSTAHSAFFMYYLQRFSHFFCFVLFKRDRKLGIGSSSRERNISFLLFVFISRNYSRAARACKGNADSSWRLVLTPFGVTVRSSETRWSA